MSHLSHSDVARVLGAVEILNTGIGMVSLPDRSLKCVLSLIPSEMTAFDSFDTGGEYTGYYWYSPSGTVSSESVSLFGEMVHEHPYFRDALSTQKERTFRTSDYLPLKKFHRTALYNEFYRLFGGETQMASAMKISPTSLVTCSLHRPKTDFSDREFGMLSLITPHLSSAIKNTQAFEKIENERKYLGMAFSRGMAVLGADLSLIFINDIAEKLLQEYFAYGATNKLPDDLLRYVRKAHSNMEGVDYCSPAEPYEVRNENSELLIRLAFDNRTNELILLLEEKIDRSANDFRCLGLTLRESEILLWMSKGKTDAEIAVLCEISSRTVEKHAEHLFIKLGVENRMSAVMTAIERLDS